jgi:ABC-2 type transport system permease protein
VLFLKRMWAISNKELRQLSRDRTSFAMIVMIPVMQLLLFGYAINTDVRHLPAGVVDQSQTAFSRQLIAEIGATQIVTFVASVATPEELEGLIRKGEVSVGLIIPDDIQRRMQQRDRNLAQLLVDGSDPVIAAVVAKLRGMQIGLRRYEQAGSRADSFAIHILYNPERRSAVNIVPGLIGVILTLTMVLFTSIAIVREKEQGTLEFLISTPLSTLELMMGKVIPYIGIGLLQASIILGLGYWVFHIPVNGALLDIILACLLFIAASLTLGLVISTMANTQLQAMQMTIFVFMPSLLLSGFMFPFDGMPVVAQWMAEVLPLTHFLRIIRGLILRGAHLSEVALEMYMLVLFTLATLSLAVFRFKKRLD